MAKAPRRGVSLRLYHGNGSSRFDSENRGRNLLSRCIELLSKALAASDVVPSLHRGGMKTTYPYIGGGGIYGEVYPVALRQEDGVGSR